MNKYLLLLIFIISSGTSFSQKGGSYYTQKQWLENTTKPEYASDNQRLMAAYYYAYKEDPDTPEGKNALAKSDSLKKLSRNNIIDRLQGKWKLKKSGSNWGFKDADSNKTCYLLVEKNIATFYTVDKTGKKEITKEEKLIFTEVDGRFYSALEFVYSDNSVWSYIFKDSTLHIFQIGVMANDMISEIICGNTEYYYSKVQD